MGSPLAGSVGAGGRRLEGPTFYDLAEDTGGHSAQFAMPSERKLVNNHNVRMSEGSFQTSVAALPSLWRSCPATGEPYFPTFWHNASFQSSPIIPKCRRQRRQIMIDYFEDYALMADPDQARFHQYAEPDELAE